MFPHHGLGRIATLFIRIVVVLSLVTIGDWVIPRASPVYVYRPSCDRMSWYPCISYIVIPLFSFTNSYCAPLEPSFLFPTCMTLIIGISTVEGALQSLILVLLMSPLCGGSGFFLFGVAALRLLAHSPLGLGAPASPFPRGMKSPRWCTPPFLFHPSG